VTGLLIVDHFDALDRSTDEGKTVEADGPGQGAGDWAAASPGDGNLLYRQKTLRFRAVESGFDESVPLRALLLLWVRAALPSFALGFLFLFIWLMTVSFNDSLFSEAESNFHVGILGTGALLSFLVFWALLLLTKIPEPIAEWNTLLENKAGAAASSYATIFGALRRRHIPVYVEAKRIRSDILSPEVVNNRLVLTDRSYAGYVSVFAYGTSLYVGWTMWRDRYGAQLIAAFVKDMVGSFYGRTGLINQMLRTEKPRAMREAMHSAVREGVDVAIAGVEVPIASTFGYELPIEDLSATSPSPMAAPPSGPPAS
jgi:hypothetical protein